MQTDPSAAVPAPADEHGDRRAEFVAAVAERIVRRYQPGTVLDVGGGDGLLVAALRDRGVEAHGLDASGAGAPSGPHVRTGSLTDPIDGRYDLITCIDVLEHVPAAEVPKAVDALCAATDRVIFSSADDGDRLGVPTNGSVQPTENWTALFAEAGFFRNHGDDVSWVAPWAMVLEHRPAMTVAAAVRDYDRRAARDQREIAELRRTAMRLERELREAREAGSALLSPRSSSLAHREQEVAAALTENLRLRDLLIVAERTAGLAQGEVARLNDLLAGHDALVEAHQAVLNSTIWRTAWKVLAPYRRVRMRLGR